jgi:hypothetical protein
VLIDLLTFCAACSINAVQTKSDRPENDRLDHAGKLAAALQLLNASIKDLVTKHRQTYCPSLEFFAAYEEKRTAVGIILPKESAIENADVSRGFPRDHVSLPKPENSADEVYAWVKSGMISCASGGSACPGPVRYVSAECGNLPEP